MKAHTPQRFRKWLPILLLLGNCSVQTYPSRAPVATPAIEPSYYTGSSDSVTPVQAAPVPLYSSNVGVQRAKSQFYYGTGLTLIAPAGVVPQQGVQTADSGADISLSFSNADLRDVAKAVLGDFLKLNYEIDPSVQGNVTLETASPVDQGAVLSIFEQSLWSAGLALVQQGNLYRIVSAADAPREAGTPIFSGQPGDTSAGFGVEVVPLHYVAAADMQRILQPITPAGTVIQVDNARNFMIISGTADQRAEVLNDVAIFDVDQMAGMSFALFSPQSVSAGDLAQGLSALMAGPAGNNLGGLVRLIVLDRLNAVLAISSQPRYLQELQPWVDRLDQPSDTDQDQLFVYRVQNGRAIDLAAVLAKVFPGVTAAPATSNDASPSTDQAGATEISGEPGGPSAPSGVANPSDFNNSSNNGITSAPASSNTADQQANNLGSLSPSGSSAQSSADSSPDNSDSQNNESSNSSNSDEDSDWPEIQITADAVNNALVIRTTPDEYATIRAALQQLDIPPLQVLIEASVAEVTLTNQLKYGVQYYFQNGNAKLIQSPAIDGAVSTALPGFSAIFENGTNISVILNALQAVTRVDVLSSPELVVLNNQTASLQVGDEVPIATEQSQSTLTSNAPIINSIEYQNTGVILKVTPRVNDGGLVTMDISQEVSEVSTTTTSTLNSPTISERQIATSVAIHDGQTLALGGLISDSRTNGKSGIPFLENIPYLGSLFSTTDHELARTELLVLLTPHVIGNQNQADAITDELRAKLTNTAPVLATGQ